MADAEKAPDLLQLVQTWAYQHLGLAGTVLLALVAGGFFVWTQWDKVSSWPGVHAIIELVSRTPVPKTDPERFSVLVAKLNLDANDTLGNQIFEVLKEFSGVEALPLDRTLARAGRMTEAMEAVAGEVARRYLQESGASILIWGSVLDREHKIAKLFLTTSSAAQQGKEGKQYQPEIGTTIRLPDGVLVRPRPGPPLDDRLPLRRIPRQGRELCRGPAANVHRRRARLLNESRDRPGWDTDVRGSTRVILADALQTLGDQSGQNAPLQEAVVAYRTALKERTRERAPLDWAGIQNNLGIALGTNAGQLRFATPLSVPPRVAIGAISRLAARRCWRRAPPAAPSTNRCRRICFAERLQKRSVSKRDQTV